jgi:phenylacetate-coenzyme A ligase PaaK-like adenylate-forming protein
MTTHTIQPHSATDHGHVQKRTSSPPGRARALACTVAAAAAVWLLSRALRLLRQAQNREQRTAGSWYTLSVAWDSWHTMHGGPAALATRQQARLADLVAYARQRSPYYRRLYRDLPERMTDVRRLPPVTKPELMAHFDEWVTDPAVTKASAEAFAADPKQIGERYLGRYFLCSTSGTTGTPALFMHDQKAMKVYETILSIRGYQAWYSVRELFALLRAGARTAVIFSMSGPIPSFSRWERVRKSSPRRAKRMLGLSVLTPLPTLVQALNEFQPAALSGYSSVLTLLAEEQIAGRLRIKPALVLTGAESLSAAAHARIEDAFHCLVRDAYGATEFQGIALECEQGWLHVNADWALLEPVGEEYQPVAVGQQSSTVLLTNLANRVQPLIRYDLGDSIVVRPDPCPCGNPLPAIHVEGRRDELLRLQDASGGWITLLPLAFGTVIEETPGVRRFQLIQTGPATLTVRLEAVTAGQENATWQAVEPRLHTYLAAQGLASVMIERASEPPKRDPRSGKFRHVWSEWPAGRGSGSTQSSPW